MQTPQPTGRTNRNIPVVVTQKQFEEHKTAVNAALNLKQQHIEKLEAVVAQLMEKVETLQVILTEH